MIYFICGKTSRLNLDKKIKISSESQNVKKMDSSLPFIFKTIENKMYQFELHPHISEIRTKIWMYAKGGMTKYIKAPAGVKVELPDL